MVLVCTDRPPQDGGDARPMIVACASMYDRYNGVREFLCQLGQERHWEIFKVRGYDRETDVVNLDAEDLGSMFITDQDKQIILEAGKIIICHQIYLSIFVLEIA